MCSPRDHLSTLWVLSKTAREAGLDHRHLELRTPKTCPHPIVHVLVNCTTIHQATRVRVWASSLILHLGEPDYLLDIARHSTHPPYPFCSSDTPFPPGLTYLQLDTSFPSFRCSVSPPTNVYGSLKQIRGCLPSQYPFSPSSLPTESQCVQESNMQLKNTKNKNKKKTHKKQLTFPGFLLCN